LHVVFVLWDNPQCIRLDPLEPAMDLPGRVQPVMGRCLVYQENFLPRDAWSGCELPPSFDGWKEVAVGADDGIGFEE
jgi:hypothetical protein